MNFRSLLLRNWTPKVLSLVGATLFVLFNEVTNLEERIMSVPLEIRTSGNFLPISDYPERVNVVLRGEEEHIELLREEDFGTYLDLTSVIESAPFTADVQIERYGAALTIDPIETRAEPVEITLNMEEQVRREVEVEPRFGGAPAPGFRLREHRIAPAFVELVGPKSIVEQISQVETNEIDLTDRRENFTLRIDLAKPNDLVLFENIETVEVSVSLEESILRSTFEAVETIVLDLPDRLTIGSALPSGSVRVQGSKGMLDAVRPGQIYLFIDGSTISEPGAYEVRPNPEVPQGLVVLRFEPTLIRLEVVDTTSG